MAWTSGDPLGFDAGDSNLYRYVNNRPTVGGDPSGLHHGNFIRYINTWRHQGNFPGKVKGFNTGSPPRFFNEPPSQSKPYGIIMPFVRPINIGGRPGRFGPAKYTGAYGVGYYPITWELSREAPSDGWVIQFVSAKATINWEDGKNRPIANPPGTYWEAWPVKKGEKVVNPNFYGSINARKKDFLQHVQESINKYLAVGYRNGLGNLPNALDDAKFIEDITDTFHIDTPSCKIENGQFIRSSGSVTWQAYAYFVAGGDVERDLRFTPGGAQGAGVLLSKPYSFFANKDMRIWYKNKRNSNETSKLLYHRKITLKWELNGITRFIDESARLRAQR